MSEVKGIPPFRGNGITLRASKWIQNPEAYCSYEAYAFVGKMVDEHEKLLELLKQTRILRNEVTAARPPERFKEWYAAVDNCSDIKITAE